MSRDLCPTEGDIRKLVDIVFQIGIVAAEHLHGKSTEEVATWVATQLRECGYDTEPVGASWGYLTSLPSMGRSRQRAERFTLIEPNRAD